MSAEETKPDSDHITARDIHNLLTYFSKNTYSATTKDVEASEALNCCIELMEIDYNVTKIPNNNGELCFQYPNVIPILESEKDTIYECQEQHKLSVPNSNDLRNFFNNAKYARCRQRFALPVILYKGKNICRSATLASVPEVCYRAGVTDVGMEALYALKEFLWPTEDLPAEDSVEGSTENDNFKGDENTQTNWPFCDKIRNEDIKLLKSLNVDTIIDIMVEKRKAKHGLYVSSSEKVDKERFSEFKLISFPYPGCEFFKKFHHNLYNAEGLIFDWDHPSCNASLSVEEDNPILKIKWENYKTWDLITITQNYLKYIIRMLQDKSSGILLHCISGWDRTPLYMSMLRLSLWADGVIHKSLDEYQILYLTLAYDWMMFGHHLADRLYKNEEILYFCFYVLKFLKGEEFNARHKIKKFNDLDQEYRGSNLSLNSNSSIVEMFIINSTSDDLNGNCTPPSFITDNNMPPAPTVPSPCCIHCSTFCETASPHATHLSRKSSSPISVKARHRTESSGSTHSTDGWQKVSGTGSLERENYFANIVSPNGRDVKLTKVREIFVDNYFKAIKRDSYGPPKRTIVEDVILYLVEKLK